MRGAPSSEQAPPPGDWTILHRTDPAMDLHLRLMTDMAEEALRGVRASEEFAARRPAEPAPGAPPRRIARRLWRTLRAG